jgi:hypothetical protein
VKRAPACGEGGVGKVPLDLTVSTAEDRDSRHIEPLGRNELVEDDGEGSRRLVIDMALVPRDAHASHGARDRVAASEGAVSEGERPARRLALEVRPVPARRHR